MKDDLKYKTKFSQQLFWDIDSRKLDYAKHRRFIVNRVLKFGDLDDWRLARQLYGKSFLRQTLRQFSDLDNKSRVFWNLILFH